MVGVPVACPQEVGDSRIRAALDEIADPVAAVQQPARGAIDVREARLAGDDALEPRGIGPLDGRRRFARRVSRGRVGHDRSSTTPRIKRTRIDPIVATTIAAMSPLVGPKPSWAASQPPTTPPMMPMTMFGRQPRAVRPPTSAPDRAPAMRPTTIQPRRPRSGTLGVSHGGRLRIAARPVEERFDRLDQRIGMGVVGGVPRARDDRDDAVR